jgi:hypothetical protein
MAEALWKRLCPVNVSDKFAAIAARARADLRTAWAAAPPAAQAALEKMLADVRAGGDAGALRLLCILKETDAGVFGAGIAARGVVIIARTIGGARPLGRAPPPAARRAQEAWAGAPVAYQGCGPQWLALVSRELSAGRPARPARAIGAALRADIERAGHDARKEVDAGGLPLLAP